MSGIEGVGEAVTGGMFARTVEPEAGEAAKEAGGTCLNCGAALIGAYCHRCGQNGHIHRTLKGFGHDLLHSVLHFEGKIWRTLPMLAWHPGELTRRYIAGERARFVSPIALFLFSVFLMFAVFSLVGGPFTSNTVARQASPEAREEVAQEQREHLVRLRERRAERAADGRDTAGIDAEIRETERALAAQRQVRQWVNPAAGGTTAPGQTPAPPPEWSRTGVSWIDKAIGKAQENPALVAYKVQTNAYKFSWALIPISVPFLWLLFLHRRRYRRYKAYDHVVFVTYSIAFMSLGLIALSLLRPLGIDESLMNLAIMLVPPIHMYRQLKGAYELSRWSALWRTFVLAIFAFIAGGTFFALILTIGGVA